jgi:hypothetical protein
MCRNCQIEEIVSGGQTGVDRAALDAALRLGVPCGGWCPRGRLAEDGVIPAQYPLRETPETDYETRTRWNVRDSDGTLVLCFGPASGGTALTLACARVAMKPCLVVDLDEAATVEPVLAWARDNKVRRLNIAGPRSSAGTAIYDGAFAFILDLLSRDGWGLTSG